MALRDRFFPGPVEAEYQFSYQNYRTRLAKAILLPTVVVYNIFLAIDYFVMPRTFWLAATLHIAVTGLIFIGTYLSIRARSTIVRDFWSALGALAMAGQVLTVAAVSHTAIAQHYQYLAVMILVFMNIIYKLEHRHTVMASGAFSAIYLGGLAIDSVAGPVYVIAATLTGAATYLTLNAHRRMERDARHSFLRRLQDSLRRSEAEIEASRDPLTGLFNRRRLEEKVEELWGQSDDQVSPIATLMIDIDHFKAFNDRHGHLVGDLCLKRVANVVAELARIDDLAIRFGGEEFLLLLPRTSLSNAIRIADRLRRAIEALAIPHETLGGSKVVTASFGVMAGAISAHTAEELIRGADDALYAAKRDGRNRVWPPLLAEVPEPTVVHLR